MKENGESTYYVVYSPTTCEYIMQMNPVAPWYIQYGYYISGCPFETMDKIKFTGSWRDCHNVIVGLTFFNNN
jgi:hypothetical protein